MTGWHDLELSKTIDAKRYACYQLSWTTLDRKFLFCKLANA